MFSLNRKTNVSKFGPHSSQVIIRHHISSRPHIIRLRTATVSDHSCSIWPSLNYKQQQHSHIDDVHLFECRANWRGVEKLVTVSWHFHSELEPQKRKAAVPIECSYTVVRTREATSCYYKICHSASHALTIVFATKERGSLRMREMGIILALMLHLKCTLHGSGISNLRKNGQFLKYVFRRKYDINQYV